jgi:hypothetical protein
LLRSRVHRAHRSHRFWLGFLAHGAYEAKAFAGKGLDEALLRAAVADRTPDLIDACG